MHGASLPQIFSVVAGSPQPQYAAPPACSESGVRRQLSGISEKQGFWYTSPEISPYHNPQTQNEEAPLRTPDDRLRTKKMKYYTEKSVSERLVQARETLHNAQEDEEIKSILAETGFAEAEFADGNSRLDAAAGLEVDQEARKGEQVKSTAELKAVYTALRRQFSLDRQLLRKVVRSNTGLYEGLRLHIRVKTGRGPFIQQASHFYDEVATNSVVLQLLQDEQNVTSDFFAIGREGLTRLIAAINVQQQMIGQAQVATRARREAMAALDEWMIEFNRTARFVFKDNERQLRKLGITVKGK